MPIHPLEPINHPPAPRPGGLGERILDGLGWLVGNILRIFFEPVAALIGRGIEVLIESLESGVENLFDVYLDFTEVPLPLRADIKARFFPHASPALPAIIVILLGAVGGLIMATLSKIGETGTKRITTTLLFQVNRETPLYRVSAEDGIMGERRGALDIDTIMSDLADLGVDRRRAEALIARSYRWLTSTQIEELYYRGIISPLQTRDYLRGVGLPDNQVEDLMLTFDRLPSASDLQRFGIREVFTPELAEPLKHPEPGDRYYVEMAKLGFSRERAEWFWMAHWRLIGETRAQDIVRRVGRGGTVEGQPTKEWYEELLRRDDVLSKYWQPLWDTRFRPLNRLDIWRLGISGRLTVAQMVEYYQDYGYSPELSAHIAGLAGEDRTTEARTLTQSLIQDAYKRRVLTRGEARAALLSMRFRAEDADLVLTLSDLQRQSERSGERTSIVRQRYLAGIISDSQVTEQLLGLGKPRDEIEDLLDLWRAQLLDRVEVPPVGTLEGWYKRRIISGPQAREELRHRGYEDRYLDTYLLEWDQEIQETEERRTAEELIRRRAELKIPTRADLAAWVKAGLISLVEFSRRLADQGYSASDVVNYARLVGLDVAAPAYTTEIGKIRVATLRESYRRDVITAKELESGLVGLGMSPQMARAIANYEIVKTL